ncbi:uncharacterized protein LOC131595434 [Vicia villosa]|uniref:uncharacterized protein LOC131595434 n=1 Tax=Vicia villosa TaxID=3911 RepID=UPI00273BC9BF|nr:uncharacterized protein LOC131595434 [Vicia villosa]
MGFHEKWRNWISECLRSTSVLVLLNGSPTKEFKMDRGLRQGDPLSPFILLIVTEGFNMLMKKAVDSEKLKGFKFERGEYRFTHLQYADDTMIICENSIKAVLLLFQAMSGLKVKFHKSSIVGLNVPQFWIDETASILKFKVDSLPLKFLGLPIWANPNRLDTWNPMVKALKSRLSQWKSSQLSIGGRIVILKSVLFAIPVFFLSFFKAPAGKRVWKNKSERKGLWYEALVNRYGLNNGGMQMEPNDASNWWKNKCQTDIGRFQTENEYSVIVYKQYKRHEKNDKYVIPQYILSNNS